MCWLRSTKDRWFGNKFDCFFPWLPPPNIHSTFFFRRGLNCHRVFALYPAKAIFSYWKWDLLLSMISGYLTWMDQYVQLMAFPHFEMGDVRTARLLHCRTPPRNITLLFRLNRWTTFCSNNGRFRTCVYNSDALFFFFSFHCCSRRNNSFGRNLYILCWILYLILEHVCVCTPFSLASLWCLFKIPGMELFLFYSTILAIELYGPSLFFFILSKRYARKGIK